MWWLIFENILSKISSNFRKILHALFSTLRKTTVKIIAEALTCIIILRLKLNKVNWFIGRFTLLYMGDIKTDFITIQYFLKYHFQKTNVRPIYLGVLSS